MPRTRAVVHTFHVAALGVWLGSLLMTGVAAAILFPTMKGLDPKLPAFAEYTGDHWMIAAGRAADRIFSINDALQLACALVVVVTLAAGAVWCNLRPTGLRGVLRLLALCVALVALGFQLFVLAPRMSLNLKTYWQAAQAGDRPLADRHQAAFSTDHTTAQNTLATITLAVGVLLLLSVWPQGLAAPTLPTTPPTPRPAGDSPLEPPALLKGLR